MTKQEWDERCADVTNSMQKYVGLFVTPLSMSEQYGFGIAWGSATYVPGGDGYTYIMTASHCITDLPPSGKLAHLPMSDGDAGGHYVAATNMATLSTDDVDAAGIAIPPILPFQPFPQRIVPAASVGEKFCAVNGELLFWMGFPGYNLERNDPVVPDLLKKTVFGHLNLPMKPMLSQEIQSRFIHPRFDASLHIAVHYPLDGKSAADNSSVRLPMPKGMSGSAIWDTKYVATLDAGGEWSPEQAEICGIVWSYIDDPGPGVVLATKIEHVRASIPNMFNPLLGSGEIVDL
jgi:hypothetical protein